LPNPNLCNWKKIIKLLKNSFSENVQENFPQLKSGILNKNGIQNIGSAKECMMTE
jgi:hypothetical protein